MMLHMTVTWGEIMRLVPINYSAARERGEEIKTFCCLMIVGKLCLSDTCAYNLSVSHFNRWRWCRRSKAPLHSVNPLQSHSLLTYRQRLSRHSPCRYRCHTTDMLPLLLHNFSSVLYRLPRAVNGLEKADKWKSWTSESTSHQVQLTVSKVLFN